MKLVLSEGMIAYMENSEDSTKKLLELINALARRPYAEPADK